MDALWAVSDRILTPTETAALSLGEAFVLACGFYLHDAGMAYAATDEGLNRIRSSEIYKNALSASSVPPSPADQARAVALAVRQLHASAAVELATQVIPGTDIYLFEAQSIRDTWAETCGRIAASHHWNIEKLERELGPQGIVPLPGGLKGDLAYVAGVLRLADYAHINRDRASTFERAFRAPIEPGSLTHWLAQEQLDGPERDGSELVYRAGGQVADVDAWWLCFEMLKGLDAEIRAVRRFLDRRAPSANRITLQGVRGAGSPEEAAAFVPTKGFLPIEINLRTGSIERLVQLLAGESLYGPDPMAAVRELIQNARDAMMLKSATAISAFDKAALSIPIQLSLHTASTPAVLEITDAGVGMTQKVMTEYLISIASDYWSSQFLTDFPRAAERGFSPAGKFGIGFLSVFMLGDRVIVESNRDSLERFRLDLRGLGRRGEIRVLSPPSGSGTRIRVTLREAVVDSLARLPELVRIYAPMVPHDLEVDVDGAKTAIPKGWISKLPPQDFHRWAMNAVLHLQRNRLSHEKIDRMDRDRRLWLLRRWMHETGASAPSTKTWQVGWPEFQEENIRLLASFESTSLLSLKGLAVQPISTPGFVGVIDLQRGALDVSRRQALDADVTEVLQRAIGAIRPAVVENLNALSADGLLIDKQGFIASCVNVYGRETVLEASVRWINLLKLPGELELVSCSDLRTRLSEAKSLFVAFGTGPWTAMRRWVALGGTKAKAELAIVLDDDQQERIPYHSGDEERLGTLQSIWSECAESALPGTLLRIVADAWQFSHEDLILQDGWHHHRDVIWGRFNRP